VGKNIKYRACVVKVGGGVYNCGMSRDLAIISSVKRGDWFAVIPAHRDGQGKFAQSSPLKYDPDKWVYPNPTDREMRGTVTQSFPITYQGKSMWVIAFLNESSSPQVWGYTLKDPNLMVRVIRRGERKKLPDTWRVSFNQIQE